LLVLSSDWVIASSGWRRPSALLSRNPNRNIYYPTIIPLFPNTVFSSQVFKAAPENGSFDVLSVELNEMKEASF